MYLFPTMDWCEILANLGHYTRRPTKGNWVNCVITAKGMIGSEAAAGIHYLGQCTAIVCFLIYYLKSGNWLR